MRLYKNTIYGILALGIVACGNPDKKKEPVVQEEHVEQEAGFNYTADEFADLKLIRYQVPGFDELSADKKELLYYLYEAALSGRDLMYAQNYQYNLQIRKTLEQIVSNDGEGEEFLKLEEYLKEFGSRMVFTIIILIRSLSLNFSREFFESSVTLIDDEKLPFKRRSDKRRFNSNTRGS